MQKKLEYFYNAMMRLDHIAIVLKKYESLYCGLVLHIR